METGSPPKAEKLATEKLNKNKSKCKSYLKDTWYTIRQRKSN